MEWWEREKLNQLEIAKIKSTIMKTKEQTYITPQVERIELDNEITLQLESTPPKAPGEAHIQAPEYFNNDPFKANIA